MPLNLNNYEQLLDETSTALTEWSEDLKDAWDNHVAGSVELRASDVECLINEMRDLTEVVEDYRRALEKHNADLRQQYSTDN